MGQSKLARQELEMRQELKEDCEPLFTRGRKVVEIDGTDYTNVPDTGGDVIGITTGDEVEVEVYENCLVVLPAE